MKMRHEIWIVDWRVETLKPGALSLRTCASCHIAGHYAIR